MCREVRHVAPGLGFVPLRLRVVRRYPCREGGAGVVMEDFEPQYHDWDRYVRDALDRPSDSAWWDERCYRTHGCVFSWADRSDDLFGESNYHVMVEELTACERDEDDPDVFTGTSSHWAVGSLSQVWVRVYSDDGELTPAFRRAVELTEEILDYSILDESDYSDREWAAFETVLADCLDTTRRRFDADTDDDHAAIMARYWDAGTDTFVGGVELCDWSAAEEAYIICREAYYLDKADDVMVDYRREVINREIPGQQWLA